MRKHIYFNILITIIAILWIIYFIQSFTHIESFTPKIHSMYRPYIRSINQQYESFASDYGPNVVMNKLKKWNIY
jgi:hypothetical protein